LFDNVTKGLLAINWGAGREIGNSEPSRRRN